MRHLHHLYPLGDGQAPFDTETAYEKPAKLQNQQSQNVNYKHGSRVYLVPEIAERVVRIHEVLFTNFWLDRVVKCLLVRIYPSADTHVQNWRKSEHFDCCGVHFFVVNGGSLGVVGHKNSVSHVLDAESKKSDWEQDWQARSK